MSGFMAGLFWPVIGLIAIVPVYLGHRLKMAKIHAQQSEGNSKLVARIEALEKRCEKLQEQANEAHILIQEEQLALDRNLAARLDPPSVTGNDPIATVPAARRKTIGADVRI